MITDIVVPYIYIYIHTYIDHSCFDLVPLPDTARGISAEVESCQSSDRIRQVVGFIPKIGCCWRICWSNMWRLRVDLGLVSSSFKIIGTKPQPPIHLGTLIPLERKLEEHLRRMENKLELLSSATSQCSEGWTRARLAPGGRRVDVEQM